METDVLKKILDDRRELLSLPQTLAEVLRLVRDESSTADDLAAILTKDPALTTKILRIVNSAYYGMSRNIGSMKQAVMTIGNRQITAIALSTSVYNLTSRWESSFDHLRFWRHSLEVAIASRMLAEAAGYKRTEEAFVAGLLHDVGLLILESSFPDEFPRVWKEGNAESNLSDLEERTWGTNHARIARFLFEQWKLPEAVCLAAGNHHTVFMKGTDEPELFIAQVVNLANRTSQFKVSEEARTDLRDNAEAIDAVLSNIGINRDQLYTVQKELFQRTLDEASFLEIDIGSSDDILMEANRVLFQQYLDVENLLDENRRMQQQLIDDRNQKISFDSLQATTGTFAEYMDYAAHAIADKAREVLSSIEQERERDSKTGLVDSINSIVDNLQTVYGMTTELRNLTELDSTSCADDTYLRIVEEKLKHQLMMIKEPA